MNNTDTQLKQALAKMLPDVIHADSLYWREYLHQVLDTELLHLCWLVEETLGEDYYSYFQHLESWCRVDRQHKDNNERLWWCIHATWQQRTIALTKTLRVEIV